MKSLFKYKSLRQAERLYQDGKEKLSFHNRPQNKHSSYTFIFIYIYLYEMQRDLYGNMNNKKHRLNDISILIDCIKHGIFYPNNNLLLNQIKIYKSIS